MHRGWTALLLLLLVFAGAGVLLLDPFADDVPGASTPQDDDPLAGAPELAVRDDGSEPNAPSGSAGESGPSWSLRLVVRVVERVPELRFGGLDLPYTMGSPAPAGEAFDIELVRGRARRVIATVRLDADGRATVPLPTLAALSAADRGSSRLWVSPRAPNRRLARVPDLSRQGAPLVSRSVRLPIEATPETTTLSLVVPVHPIGGFVTGRVVWADGTPVPSASVVLAWARVRHAIRYRTMAPPAVAHSDEAGRFQLLVSQSGERQLIVRAPSDHAHVEEPDQWNARESRDLGTIDLGPRPSPNLRGTMRFADGAPVRDAALSLVRFSTLRRIGLPGDRFANRCRATHDVRTDASGGFAFTVGHTPPGSAWILRISAMADTKRRLMPLHERLSAEGLQRGGPPLSIQIDAHHLRGRVVDGSGAPIPHARISVGSDTGAPVAERWLHQCRTNGEGAFDALVPRGASGRLQVDAPGTSIHREALTVPANANESECTVVLSSLPEDQGIEVRLGNAENAPLLDTTLRVETPDGLHLRTVVIDGTPQRLMLGAGPYVLRAFCKDLSKVGEGGLRWLRLVREVAVRPHRMVPVEMVLQEAAHLSVRFENYPKIPIDDLYPIRYTIVHEDGQEWKGTEEMYRPQAGEPFAVREQLAPGLVTVTIDVETCERFERMLYLDAGRMTVLDVPLERARK